MRNVCLTVLFSVLFGSGYAQQLLFQKNKDRQVYYKAGERIAFRIEGDRTKYAGEIKGLEDSLIVFDFFKVNLKDISHLYVDDKIRSWYILRYKISPLLLLTGGAYLFIEAVNQGAWSDETLMFSGSMIGAGLLTKLVVGNRIKIQKKRKLVIV